MNKLAMQNNDQDFAKRRVESRREDEIAMATGKASPAKLQQRNSILPGDFWKKAKVNWSSLAVGKKSYS
jgi:hypothetical protein